MMEMSQDRKNRLCEHWIQYCQSIGWSGRKTLGELVDIFWKYDGWKTFKGYQP